MHKPSKNEQPPPPVHSKKTIPGKKLVSFGPPKKEMMRINKKLTVDQEGIHKEMAIGKPTQFNGTAPFDALKASLLTGAATNACSSIARRRPWSKASKGDRKKYLEAAACLATKPGKFARNGLKSSSIHDDFVLLHQTIADIIHGSAFLLPCHRLFLNAWFYAMQRHCGYDGDLLYFDVWTYGDRDELWTTDDLWSDDLYGPVNGNVATGCQRDYRVRFAAVPRHSQIVNQVDRALQRHLRTSTWNGLPIVNYMTSDYIDAMLDIDEYDAFRLQLERSTHQYLHISAGGDLIPATSPTDVYFYAIHAAIDAIYTAWQEKNGGTNRFKFDGPRLDGSGQTVTPQDTCPMLHTWAVDFNVEDLLDVRTKPNCYSYDFQDGGLTVPGIQ